MPQFEIKEQESVEVAKITFHKESDYKAIEMNGKIYLEHKVLADKLIAKKLAKKVDAKLETREVESTSTVQKK
jgi:hypothetical protein